MRREGREEQGHSKQRKQSVQRSWGGKELGLAHEPEMSVSPGNRKQRGELARGEVSGAENREGWRFWCAVCIVF